jgi:hypothetical protein
VEGGTIEHHFVPIPEFFSEQRLIWLEAKGPAGTWTNVEQQTLASETGEFQFRQVAPGSYRIRGTMSIRVGNASKSFTTEQATQVADRDVNGLAIKFYPSAQGEGIEPEGKLEAVLSKSVGSISGVVRDPTGAGSAGATVAVWSAHGFLARDIADALGRFEIQNVPPGAFRMAAWEDIDHGLIEAPKFRAAFERQEAAVSVMENSAVKVDLTAIPRQISDFEVDKLK